MRASLTVVSVGLLLVFGRAIGADASEIVVWTSSAGATVLADVGPQFEQKTGHKLNVTSALGAQFLKKIDAGEPFDVLISPPPIMDGLIKDHKIITETRTPLVRSGLGVGVRAGTPKPDISTVGAFKQILLNAKSIGYLRVSSGVYVEGMLIRLGIAETLKSKITRPETDAVSTMVANGELELAIIAITQILTTPGVELVGPLPPELQSYIEFVAGVSSNSKDVAAATELINFLRGPIAVPVIKAQGMEPL